jgi:Protein of unknown function (DUF3152)
MPTPENGTRARRRVSRRVIRRRREVAGGVLLMFVALLVMSGFRLAAAFTGDNVATLTKMSTAPRKSPSASGLAGPAVRGTGQYARATGSTVRQGSGKLMTYRVEVETGTGQSAQGFAAAVDATLADPASWAGQGQWSVQRVAGEDVDLIIRLATSATVGEVCEAAGLEDAAYSSCRTGQFVMINLDRWLNAVPEYKGDVALYRQYVINHEVGHGLGFDHQACPGPGRPAPVMQQQTLSLDGCLPNGSPYVAGVLVSGPAKT